MPPRVDPRELYDHCCSVPLATAFLLCLPPPEEHLGVDLHDARLTGAEVQSAVQLPQTASQQRIR